jgi:hypothetical protein
MISQDVTEAASESVAGIEKAGATPKLTRKVCIKEGLDESGVADTAECATMVRSSSGANNCASNRKPVSATSRALTSTDNEELSDDMGVR